MQLYKFQGEETYYAVADTLNEAARKIYDDTGIAVTDYEVSKEELPSYEEEV